MEPLQHKLSTTARETQSTEGAEAVFETMRDSKNKETKKVSSKALHQFIHEKVTKLTTALYMVSSYMKADEPIRVSLRNKGVNLVSYSSSLSQDTIHDQLVYLNKDITEIVTLLEIGGTMSLISQMNAEILLTEYRALLGILDRERARYETRQFALSTPHEALFYSTTLELGEDDRREVRLLSTVSDRDVLRETSHVQSAQQKEISPIKVSLKDTEPKKEVSLPEAKLEIRENRREVVTEPKEQQVVEVKSYERKVKTSLPEIKERRMSRRQQVLSLLSKSEPQSIRDISARIRGCSEKTVQRELNDLLANKEIKRIGEKRWSKYILA
jgi:virulence-associated protein VagC